MRRHMSPDILPSSSLDIYLEELLDRVVVLNFLRNLHTLAEAIPIYIPISRT